MGEFVNSKQVRFNQSFVSCGVLEAHHLPDASPSETVFAIANSLYHKANGRPAAFVIFSDTVDRREARGVELAAKLKTLGVGQLIESSKEVNPKSGHVIRLWVFTPNHEAFRKWYGDEYVNRVSEAAG